MASCFRFQSRFVLFGDNVIKGKKSLTESDIAKIKLEIDRLIAEDLPAAFHALEAGDNRTFHQCIHRIHGAANILNLQKLINLSHQLEVFKHTPASMIQAPLIICFD